MTPVIFYEFIELLIILKLTLVNNVSLCITIDANIEHGKLYFHTFVRLLYI